MLIVHPRADYADDSYIQELLHWTHPHLHPTPADVEFTDAEQLAMLNLPRRECGAPSPCSIHIRT